MRDHRTKAERGQDRLHHLMGLYEGVIDDKTPDSLRERFMRGISDLVAELRGMGFLDRASRLTPAARAAGLTVEL
jgi:hypothetical protein